jgi:hypothetical protein
MHHEPLPAIRLWQSTKYCTAPKPFWMSMFVLQLFAYSFAHFHGWLPRLGSQLQTIE